MAFFFFFFFVCSPSVLHTFSTSRRRQGSPPLEKKGKKKKHIIVRVFGAAAQADGRGEVAVDIGMCSLRLSDRSWWIATGGRRWLRTVLLATGCECRVARGGGQSERIHTYVHTYIPSRTSGYLCCRQYVHMHVCVDRCDRTGSHAGGEARDAMCAVVVCMTERRRHSAGWIGRPCIVRRLPFPRNTTSPSAVSNHVSGRQQRKMHYIHAYPRGEGGIQEKGGIQERGRGGGEGRRRDGGTPVDGKIKSRNEPHPNDQLDCRGVMGTGLWGRCEHTSYHRYHQSYSPPVLTPGRAALLSLGMGLRV